MGRMLVAFFFVGLVGIVGRGVYSVRGLIDFVIKFFFVLRVLLFTRSYK